FFGMVLECNVYVVYGTKCCDEFRCSFFSYATNAGDVV
ncbi:MAG: hypothetical protein RL472_1755, partial [Pseudomonadota bacterium]